MPAGRSQVDYTDINYDALTFKIDGTSIIFDQTQVRGAAATMIGKAVSLSANDTVGLANDGDAIMGKLLEVFKDGFCTVQHRGFVTLPLGTSAPGTATLGRRAVGAQVSSARGYVRDANSATAAEVIRGRAIVINNADTNNVWVDLG